MQISKLLNNIFKFFFFFTSPSKSVHSDRLIQMFFGWEIKSVSGIVKVHVIVKSLIYAVGIC